MNIVHVDYPAPNNEMTPRALSQISDAIVHHTAGPVSQTPLEIDAEHRNIGDAMIAYNAVITPDGTVYDGRPLDVVPAAAFGRNVQSVNVVLVGNFETGDPGFTGSPTAAQENSLLEYLKYIHRQLPSIVRTIGHRDVATLFYPNDTADYATACPGSVLASMLPAIKAKVAAQLNLH